jgi:hypothetical protein
MSMSRKALKLVQNALPQLRLCKDMLVLPPTEHILRAFSFERTPYKGTFYLWRVVLPLYRFESRKILSYSKRIPRGTYVHLSRQAPDQSAAEITRIISEDIPKLDPIRTPLDFLDLVGWTIGNDKPSFLLDLAVTYFLIGRHHEALLGLYETSAEAEKRIAHCIDTSGPNDPLVERLTEIRRVADCLAGDIRSDPRRATEMIRDWERKNIAQFDLGETVSSANPM